MKKSVSRWALPAVLVLGLLLFASCIGGTASTPPDFYDAGAANLSVTGAQFDQYTLFRFDTSAAPRSLALPSAADIVNNLSSPYAGEVLILGVAATGANPVTLIAGTNVTVEPNAATVPANTTLTMYAVLNSITSGSEAVTIY